MIYIAGRRDDDSPQLGEIYDAELISVETPDSSGYISTDYMYYIKHFSCTYSDYWVMPLRDYNIDIIL